MLFLMNGSVSPNWFINTSVLQNRVLKSAFKHSKGTFPKKNCTKYLKSDRRTQFCALLLLCKECYQLSSRYVSKMVDVGFFRRIAPNFKYKTPYPSAALTTGLGKSILFLTYLRPLKTIVSSFI